MKNTDQENTPKALFESLLKQVQFENVSGVTLFLMKVTVLIFYAIGILILLLIGLYGIVSIPIIFISSITILPIFLLAEKYGLFSRLQWTIYEWKDDESAAKRAAYSFGRIILALFIAFTITILIRSFINPLLELFIGEKFFVSILVILSVPIIVSLIDYILGLFSYIKK